jgi:signal transduction histidine kinase
MLQGISRQVGEGHEAQQRIAMSIEQLDETIREVRATITDLHDPSLLRTANLTSRLQLEVNAAITLLGFTPQFEMHGDLISIESVDLIEQLVAITREALTNVAKHANAGAVLVRAFASDTHVSISVIDDGIGIPVEPSRRSGVKNIEMRAKRMRGECYIGPRRDQARGTEIDVSVPIH